MFTRLVDSMQFILTISKFDILHYLYFTIKTYYRYI